MSNAVGRFGIVNNVVAKTCLVVAAWSFASPGYGFVYGNGDFSESETGVELRNGAVVVHADKPTTVRTARGDIEIKTGTDALVRASEDGVVVRNMNELRRHCVEIVRSQGKVPVGLGHEVYISDTEGKLYEDSRDNIGRRNIHTFKVDAAWVRSAEFNLQDNLVNDPLLADLRRQESGDCRKLSEKLIKTTAIWTVVTRGRHPYNRQALRAMSGSKRP